MPIAEAQAALRDGAGALYIDETQAETPAEATYQLAASQSQLAAV